jgi:hypothetical protein
MQYQLLTLGGVRLEVGGEWVDGATLRDRRPALQQQPQGQGQAGPSTGSGDGPPEPETGSGSGTGVGAKRPSSIKRVANAARRLIARWL